MTLSFEENPYQGVELNPETLPESASGAFECLEETLGELKLKGYQLAWLLLVPERAEAVPAALKAGFEYHHAGPEEGVLLVCRLNPDAHVPEYATHYIGVGGVVLDEENRLLVIQERHHVKKHYKLPGGALDPGEHISDAALREVFEETGIRTEFLSLHCFRHWHGYRYRKSDIYFVCRLKPLNHDITADPREISEARWMPLDDFLSDPDTHPFNRRIVSAAAAGSGLTRQEIAGYGSPETHEMFFPEDSPKEL